MSERDALIEALAEWLNAGAPPYSIVDALDAYLLSKAKELSVRDGDIAAARMMARVAGVRAARMMVRVAGVRAEAPLPSVTVGPNATGTNEPAPPPVSETSGVIGWLCVETATNADGVVIHRKQVGTMFRDRQGNVPTPWTTPNGTRYTYSEEPVGTPQVQQDFA